MVYQLPMENQQRARLTVVEPSKMDTVISSPDSAIDVSDESNSSSSKSVAQDVIDILIDLVVETSRSPRRRKKKKEKTKFSDSEKWELMRDCGVVGWKRILARNSDVDGGWGFNFISPNGIRLTSKELDKFLKLRKLQISELLFQEAEDSAILLSKYPRKRAKLKIGVPVEKIRDLKLSKKMEMEKRKAKILQSRLENASKPQFKSISEFLASLERCDSQNSNEGSCSDTSRLEDYSDSELEQQQVSDPEHICRDILLDCLNRLLSKPTASASSAVQTSPTPAQLPRDKSFSLSQHKSEDCRRPTTTANKSSPKSLEKIKIRIGEPIQKLKITPEKLGKKKAAKSPGSRDSDKSPIKVSIKTPKSKKTLQFKGKKSPILNSANKFRRKNSEASSPDRAHESSSNSDVEGGSSREHDAKRKYSIFKSRNSALRTLPGSHVKFTDQTVGKDLCIRANQDAEKSSEKISGDGSDRKSMSLDAGLDESSSKLDFDPDETVNLDNQKDRFKCKNKTVKSDGSESAPVIGSEENYTELEDVEDEFSAEQGTLVSPSKVQILASPNKVKVVEKYTPEKVPPVLSPSRKLVFGLHSPICQDEFRPEDSARAGERDVTAPVKPALRTHGRVISSEEAIKAIDAVVDPQVMPRPEDHQSSESSSRGADTPSVPTLSPLTTPLTTPTNNNLRLATPSLPILSPQVGEEEVTHSNMTTPSLPSLSPALSARQALSGTPNPPSSLVSPLPVKDTRRKSGEGKLMRPDPQMAKPLSVVIPSEGHKEKRAKHEAAAEKFNKSSEVISSSEAAAVPKTPETATGRKMRDCRKFIHYEFSPPFASDDSSTDQESPVPMKLAPAASTASIVNGEVKKKKGRPPKNKDTASLAKKKKGRPEKANNADVVNVSELARKLSEDHISPITRERVNFPNTEKRRASVESSSIRKAQDPKARLGRSKSTDVSEPTSQGLEETKQNLRKSQLLMLTIPMESSLEQISEDGEMDLRSTSHNAVKDWLKNDSQGCDGVGSSIDTESGTLFVRKRVRVQSPSDPLFRIRDQIPRPSSKEDVRPKEESKEDLIPGSCVLYPQNLELLDGLKVLTRIGKHFYRGKASAVEPPYIFAVSLEGERGNKPHIYTREELLEKVIIEVRPRSTKHCPVGTRVCTYWSTQLQYLYPGTVQQITKDRLVVVELDDGDEREVSIDSLRLLPPDYPLVETEGIEQIPLGEVEGSTLTKHTVQELASPGKQSPKAITSPRSTSGKPLGKGSILVPKKKKETKSKHKIMADFNSKPVPAVLEDPTLKEESLKDGLRVLARMEGHFHPGRLNCIKPPDIYGILLDRERGFRPHIYAREELLKSAIKEIRVKMDRIAVGTRVCAYWSNKYHFLHPGTVVPFDQSSTKLGSKYVNVELDDGDSRELSIDQIRLLPHNYPLVVYDDDSALHSPGRKKVKATTPTPAASPKSAKVETPTPSPKSSKPDTSQSKPCTLNTSTTETKPLTATSNQMQTKIREQENTSPDLPSVDHRESEKSDHVKPELPPKNTKTIKKPIDVPVSSGPVDLVGLISKGMDKLVDRKVGAPRPDWTPPTTKMVSPGSTPFYAPAYPSPGSPHPGLHPPLSPRPPFLSPGTLMHGPPHQYPLYPPPSPRPPFHGGFLPGSPSPPLSIRPPGTPFHPSQSLAHSPLPPHFYPPPGPPTPPHGYPGPVGRPPYPPPPPTPPYTGGGQVNCSLPLLPPPPPGPDPAAESSTVDQQTKEENESGNEKDELLPKPETGLKVKSRLSNLIAAVSGKISRVVGSPDELTDDHNTREDERPVKPTLQPKTALSPAAEKWNNAFNVKKTTSPESKLTSKPPATPNDAFEEGFLTPNRIVVGTKILLLKDGLLYLGSIAGVEGENFVVALKNLDLAEKARTLNLTEDKLVSSAVLDVPAMSVDRLKSGSRVAVYPMHNATHLVPGSVRKVLSAYNIQVVLDSGPIKDINCENVKIIPGSFIPKKPSFNGISDVKMKPPVTNTYSSGGKNKPNLLLGYDYVDTDKSDVQAQWETAISRKSAKKPEKRPPEKENQEIAETDAGTKTEDPKQAIANEIRNTLNLIINKVTDVDEEKMRQSLIIEALKKYSPKKEPGKLNGPKSPRAIDLPKPKKKKSKSKDGERKSSTDSGGSDDIKELLSICKESNINTPGKKVTTLSVSEDVAPHKGNLKVDTNETEVELVHNATVEKSSDQSKESSDHEDAKNIYPGNDIIKESDAAKPIDNVKSVVEDSAMKIKKPISSDQEMQALSADEIDREKANGDEHVKENKSDIPVENVKTEKPDTSNNKIETKTGEEEFDSSSHADDSKDAQTTEETSALSNVKDEELRKEKKESNKVDATTDDYGAVSEPICVQFTKIYDKTDKKDQLNNEKDHPQDEKEDVKGKLGIKQELESDRKILKKEEHSSQSPKKRVKKIDKTKKQESATSDKKEQTHDRKFRDKKLCKTRNNGHSGDRTFFYRDPIFPDGWFIKVKVRRCGTKADSYYYTPCRTVLRSRTEITKFLEGNFTGKMSSVDSDVAYENIPLKAEIKEDDQTFLPLFDHDFFVIKKENKRNDHNQAQKKSAEDSGQLKSKTSVENCVAKDPHVGDQKNQDNDKKENNEDIKLDKKTKTIKHSSKKEEKENLDITKEKSEEEDAIKSKLKDEQIESEENDGAKNDDKNHEDFNNCNKTDILANHDNEKPFQEKDTKPKSDEIMSLRKRKDRSKDGKEESKKKLKTGEEANGNVSESDESSSAIEFNDQVIRKIEEADSSTKGEKEIKVVDNDDSPTTRSMRSKLSGSKDEERAKEDKTEPKRTRKTKLDEDIKMSNSPETQSMDKPDKCQSEQKKIDDLLGDEEQQDKLAKASESEKICNKPKQEVSRVKTRHGERIVTEDETKKDRSKLEVDDLKSEETPENEISPKEEQEKVDVSKNVDKGRLRQKISEGKKVGEAIEKQLTKLSASKKDIKEEKQMKPKDKPKKEENEKIELRSPDGTSDDCFKVPTIENLRMLRSGNNLKKSRGNAANDESNNSAKIKFKAEPQKDKRKRLNLQLEQTHSESTSKLSGKLTSEDIIKLLDNNDAENNEALEFKSKSVEEKDVEMEISSGKETLANSKIKRESNVKTTKPKTESKTKPEEKEKEIKCEEKNIKEEVTKRTLRSDDAKRRRKLRNNKVLKSPKKIGRKLISQSLKDTKTVKNIMNDGTLKDSQKKQVNDSLSKAKENVESAIKKSAEAQSDGTLLEKSVSGDSDKKETVKSKSQNCSKSKNVSEDVPRPNEKDQKESEDKNSDNPPKKSSENKPKLRGPASKRKYSYSMSSSDEDEPPSKVSDSSVCELRLAQVTASLKEKGSLVADIHTETLVLRSSCSTSVVNLFSQRLVETPCGHCLEAGPYLPESLEVDLPTNRLFMECLKCKWTTVRKISVNNRVF